MPEPFVPSRLLVLAREGIRHPFRTWQDPVSVPASSAAFLRDSDEVIAVEAGGTSRAYPLRIIAAHHIVQDRIGEQHVMVTF